jgi:CRISP-associated protein Cas1
MSTHTARDCSSLSGWTRYGRRTPMSLRETGGIGGSMAGAVPRLGITAKLDLVEGAGGQVVPVDVKKGHPAADGTAWEADAVQVCAQILLLREQGYACEHGEIFYAETRQRVVVEPEPALIARTMEIVGQARSAASRLAPPVPLRSSPKCPR